MGNGEYERSESKDKIITIYADFMTRITQLEELVPAGSRLLNGFQQALGFLGRPPIDKTSTLVERIIEANSSRRVLSYVEAGCINSHDSSQNVEVHTFHLGLLDYVNKAKIVIDELEFLLDNVKSVLQTAREKEDVNYSSDSVVSLSDNEKVPSSDLSKPEVEEYATTMAIVYSMVKQDYTMQELVVSAINHKSSLGELETYCQMWALRPFVDDDVMCRAWALVSKP